MYMEFIVW